jgi:hypothetical protein
MTNCLSSDPAELSPPQWQSRLASLKSHGLPDNDPRVAECRAALAYWRCRRVLDAERGKIAPDHLDELVESLRGAVRVR